MSTRRGGDLAARHPGVRHHADADRLLEQTEAELVVVTAPNDVHAPLVRKAVLLGKHVVVEKPFVLDPGEGLELAELAKARGVVLSVYHNRRWDGDFLTLADLVGTGAVGPIRYLESRWDRYRPRVRDRWREDGRPGSGTLYDLGSHLIDQVVALFGLPDALTARVLALRPGSPSADWFHLLLHYPEHEVAVHSSSHSAAPSLRFRLEGDGGSWVCPGFDPQEVALREGTLDLAADPRERVDSRAGTLHVEGGPKAVPLLRGGYRVFYDRLADALRRDGAPPVPAEEALHTVRLIELARRSSAEGRTLAVPPYQKIA